MGLGIPKLVDLRDEWAVQSLVLFSFSLQVFLLMFAWIRRRSVSTVVRSLLWLAYQLADSTAVFTLGHLSISSCSRLSERHHLVGLWAPFLLVHLGGQDTITAYSFEDNGLWLRHLETLVVQVLVVAYVLYKHMPVGENSELTVAAVLILLVGVLKYGERVWVLRSATFGCIWSTLDSTTEAASSEDPLILEFVFGDRVSSSTEYIDEDAILIGAHGLLDVCKGLFIGAKGRRLENIQQVLRSFEMHSGGLDRLMEMELSLMYDILYTKAAVIHTWHGWCIRVVSLVATAVALLLFQLSSSSKHERKADVAVTYVLLGGALLLEVASVVRVAVSTWTQFLLRGSICCRPGSLIRNFRRFFSAARHRRWSGSLGQYNLLDSCASNASWKRNCMEKAARSLGLGRVVEYWFGHSHWRTAKLSDSTTEIVLRKILAMGKRGSLPGLLALQRLQPRMYNIEDMGFEDSIVAWHLATEICLRHSAHMQQSWASTAPIQDLPPLCQAVRVLSNYIMFLLVLRPYMLPGPVRRSRYTQARDDFREMMRASPPEKGWQDWWQNWFFKALSPPYTYDASGLPKLSNTGLRIAKVLIEMHELDDMERMMEILFGVWVEMVCYVANHCSRESHARQLSNGGELVTIVWLMARHANLSQLQTGRSAIDP